MTVTPIPKMQWIPTGNISLLQPISVYYQTFINHSYMKKMQVLNFPISIGKYQDYIEYIIDSATAGVSQYIYVANVHMLVEAF